MMDLLTKFHENCGCGLMANIKNKPTRQMTLDSIEALKRMIHRGAIAADGKSGDGCGFLFSLPKEFMIRAAKAEGHDLPSSFAVAMMFITDEFQKELFCEICKKNDLKVLFFRKVPINTDVLGKQALEVLPEIVQAFVVPNAIIATQRFEALLYLTRKETEHALKKANDFYIASFSSKVIAYKGLVMPTFIKDLYLDLQADDFAVSFALFHQRFSTNTLPRWGLAQPFRTLAHNGEINSIRGNRFNVEVISEQLESDVYSKEELERIFPILVKGVSDSASVDNMFEFLITNGRDFFQTIRSMVPPPWQNAPQLDPKLRAFYEYTSNNMEAWDGPAALSFTDGRYLGCVLDRNGLRPAKYIITRDDRIVITSEYGVVDIEPSSIEEQGKLKSGQMIGVDLKYGKVLKDEDINDYLKNLHPFGQWLNNESAYLMEHAEQNFCDFSDYELAQVVEMQRYHNITNEVVEGVIRPMIEKGKEETGSMGDDTPLACFSKIQRNFTDFFRQKFAQVTNPPIDPLREKVVMSTSVTYGPKNNILVEGPQNAHRLKTMSPILSKEKFDVLYAFGNTSDPLYDPVYKNVIIPTCFKRDLRMALYDLGRTVITKVQKEGVKIILLDDRCLTKENSLIPMPMAIGYLNSLLKKEKLRSQVDLVAITGEVYDSHSAAVMLAYGAISIYPYLAYATALQVVDRNKESGKLHRKQALSRIHHSINGGILKIMSKMGICTVESYKNAALFDVIGLSNEIVEQCFAGSIALLPGLSYEDIEYRLHKHHKIAYKRQIIKKMYPLEVGSFYKYMDNGEYHDYSPDVARAISKFSRTGKQEDYVAVRDRINNRGLRMIRDFFHFHSDRPSIPIDLVEPVEDITKRFSSAAMSLGSISPEAHEAIAEAMNFIGGSSNSGEGGEDAVRFNTNKNSKIKQIASGRFGVTSHYLQHAEELQIKVAQGAKPGEGGQLPGSKVSPLIARLRCTTPGVTLISPPPHHDIYSIEDLAQLIFDLKQVNPKARVSVKLVSTAGVGTIAVGVAKAYADKIIISGADGGTGAAQLGSIKFAGNPWELGLSEAHNALKVNGLREFVELQTDGGLKTGLDIVKAAILGAESYAFGTSILNTVGCKILRVCHLNKCSVGIATQDKTLRTYYKGTVEGIINYLQSIAQEVREILATLGYNSLDEIIGQTQLLEVVNDEFAKRFDFSSILYKAEGENIRKKEKNEPFDKNQFEQDLLTEILPTIKSPQFPIVVHREIKNTHRSFGTRTSGIIASFYGNKGLAKETIKINLTGNAGQSLGAFMSNGLLINLKGTANDYVGKGMSGGHIIITPSIMGEQYSLAGNTCLYGATGGKLFVAGKVGERFAVRNSGALAVVEGTGDHPCEYMTGGTVVILGETGRNFGAGMTGGVAFVYDKHIRFMDKMNHELIKAERIDTDEGDEGRHYLKKILRSYYYRTQSTTARNILEHFRDETRYFWMVTSKEMNAPLNPMDGN
ncbi:MAG: glutamate synthase large subunit [Flammeovirgaceae bacterium]